MHENPFRLLGCQNHVSPFKKFTLDTGELSIVFSACCRISCGTVHVQVEEHSLESRLPMRQDLVPIDPDRQFLTKRVEVHLDTSRAIPKQAFQHGKMSPAMCLAPGLGVSIEVLKAPETVYCQLHVRVVQYCEELALTNVGSASELTICSSDVAIVGIVEQR